MQKQRYIVAVNALCLSLEIDYASDKFLLSEPEERAN